MKCWCAGALVLTYLWTSSAAGAGANDDQINPTLADGAAAFRVFLKDGTSLVSYGELARVNDRVVFSMPTSADAKNPPLHLVNLASAHVDWERTNRYAESVRAARYMATMAEHHYATLTAEIAQALNDVGSNADPAKRLEIVERARKTLADWPGRHFNYKQAEIGQMVALLDEAIADLRAAAGVERFDLSLVTSTAPVAGREPLLPLPTPKEAVEATLTAARLADSPAERVSLTAVAVAAIDRDADVLPSEWRTEVRREAQARIELELETDRAYQSLSARMLARASERAKAADVRGVERVLADIRIQDGALGGKRPETVDALVVAVDAHLDAARVRRLERDRWALRAPELRKYQAAVSASLNKLAALAEPLEDIKALAGSGPDALALVLRVAREVTKTVTAAVPPVELQAVHSLLISAAQLADSAARTRREAALTGSMPRAWDASAAAAGALMLTVRARADMQTELLPPHLRR
jgi:hypothetical protein